MMPQFKIKDHRFITKTEYARPKLKVIREKKNLEQIWSKIAAQIPNYTYQRKCIAKTGFQN